MFTGTPNSIRTNAVKPPAVSSRLRREALNFSRFLLAAFLLTPPAHAGPVLVPIETPAQWVHAGEIRDLTVHKIGKDLYLKLEHLARLSDAQIRWQPAAGQVCLNNANGELCFDWESKAVSFDDRRLRETVAMRFENDQLFVPISFVTSDRFQAFSATRLSWNADHLRLVQDPEVNLRIPQVERAEGVYRLAFDINPQSQPQLIEKSDKRIWLRFGRAISDGSQVLEGDTVIHEVRVVQKRHSADLILNLGDDAADSDVYFEDAKRRLVISVTPSPRVQGLPVVASAPTETSKPDAARPDAAPAPKPAVKAVKSHKLSIPEHAPVLTTTAVVPRIVTA